MTTPIADSTDLVAFLWDQVRCARCRNRVFFARRFAMGCVACGERHDPRDECPYSGWADRLDDDAARCAEIGGDKA
jgi:hypothetical protein